MNRLSPTERAYLAGFIDGEGCIAISRTHTSAAAKGNRRGYSYRGSIVVSLTDLDVLRWCHQVTGVGQVCLKRHADETRRMAWAWSTWSIQAAELASAIRPYLILKGQQADLLIEFQKRMRQPGRIGLSDLEWNFREYCWIQSRTLNQKGPRR